jgi:hypothetical protein
MRKILLAATLAACAVLGVVLATGLAGPGPAPGPIVKAAYATVPSAPAAAPVAATATADDLPTVDVKPYAVHTAPSDAESLPARPYTVVPIAGEVVERGLPHSAPVRRPVARTSLEPVSIAGRAAAAGAIALEIEGRRVALFGVKLLPRDDGAAARAALQRHLAATPAVTCTAPPGQSGAAAYVCRTGAGLDLGGFLVAQGLAAADRGKSYQ